MAKTKERKLEKLWAEYGKLSAQRERVLVLAQQTALRMNKILEEITTLEATPPNE